MKGTGMGDSKEQGPRRLFPSVVMAFSDAIAELVSHPSHLGISCGPHNRVRGTVASAIPMIMLCNFQIQLIEEMRMKTSSSTRYTS